MIRTLSLSLAALSMAACASQVDGTHQGDSLAEIAGSVRNTRTLPVSGEAEVVVVWNNSSGSPDLSGTDSVEVEGTFPANFTLSIYEPPDDALLNDWNGVKVGVAYIIAGLVGTDYSSEQAAEAGILGLEDDHLLVYVPADVPAGSDASIVLRGTPAAGFHVYGVNKLTDQEIETRQQCEQQLGETATLQQLFTECGGFPSFDDFVPLGTDLGTPLDIELVDDLESVDVPNWT
jgi:hypothetical protein